MSRKSIITEYVNISAFSGEPAECSHELLFGKGIRELAIKDGLVLPLTNSEHNMATKPQDRIHDNPRAEDLSKIAGQLGWEKEFYKKQISPDEDPAREEFRKRYGKSWL